MPQIVGKQSIQFEQAPYVLGSASIVGKKEGEGPLGKLFDVVGEDDKFGEDTWEEAESTLQKEAVMLAMGKAGLKKEDIRYIFGGDLLGQNIATTFGLLELNIPLFGLYGACSTAGESLSLAAMAVIWGECPCRYFQSFRKRGEAVSISLGVCQSKAPISYLDGHRERSLCTWDKKGKGSRYGNYHWKGSGLRHQGLHEYGGGHGPGGLSHHPPEF